VHGIRGSASIGNTIGSFFDAAGKFFSDLAAVHWGALFLGLGFFAANLTLRSRALFNTMRAAYPAERIEWRRIWGAYVAAVGFNNLVPARGGDVIKLFLCKSSIRRSSFPAVAACFSVESIFDTVIGFLVLVFAFSQGVFPKPPDFAKLNTFDLSYVAGHFRLTLFVLTALAITALVAFAVLGSGPSGSGSARVWRSSRTAPATSARSSRSRRSPGCVERRPSGSCSMPSGSAGRFVTSASCSASTPSPERFR